jgi:hypothetical protein
MGDCSVEAKPPRVNASLEADVAFWARLLDAHPDELRRAVELAGSEISAVREFLSSRQMHLDFDEIQRHETDRRSPC